MGKRGKVAHTILDDSCNNRHMVDAIGDFPMLPYMKVFQIVDSLARVKQLGS